MNDAISEELVLEAANHGVSQEELYALLRDFTPLELQNSRNICFVMFSPDAIAQKAIAQVLDQYDLVVLDHKFIDLSKLSEHVYESDIITRRLHSWWIKNKIFKLGNTFVALVTCKKLPAEYTSLYQYLLTIKGASDPALCKKGTVRYTYHVSSKAFGFMHSSDDNFSSLREALVFFSQEEIRRAIYRTNSLTHNMSKFDYSYKPQILNLNFYFLLFSIKKSILHSIKHTCQKDFFYNLLSIYDNALTLARKNLPYKEEKALFAPILSEENRLIYNCLNRDFIQKLLMYDTETLDKFLILFKLSCPQLFASINSSELLRKIAGHGIILDNWEKLLLTASLFFYSA